jgi:starvation-inducible DNA-binding protein
MQTATRVEESALPNNIGTEEQGRRETVEGLSRLLADTHMLYLKTHNFHWNVTGPMFYTLHLMFEEQYTELWQAGDLIAERIRALGFTAPGSYREFSKLTYLQEAEGVPAAEEMIRQLVRDHETVARTARWALSVARSAIDAPTEDLLTQRLTAHEKAAWMLRSLSAEE